MIGAVGDVWTLSDAEQRGKLWGVGDIKVMSSITGSSRYTEQWTTDAHRTMLGTVDDISDLGDMSVQCSILRAVADISCSGRYYGPAGNITMILPGYGPYYWEMNVYTLLSLAL